MTCSTKTATKRQNSPLSFYRYLESLNENRYRFTLARVKKALRLLGNPQDSFDVIHTAGSNGKGSVCTYLSYILSSHGIKTGLYTSPHLKSPLERIKINNTDISGREFCAAGEKLKRSLAKAGVRLTYFEFMTVLCFVIFRQAKVKTAVIETGLGGRLDATNMPYKMKKLAVLTSISLEHTRYLGNTRKKILLEKEKIIGRAPCVHNLHDPRLSALLRRLHPGMVHDAAGMIKVSGVKTGPGGCSAVFGYEGGLVLRTKMAEPVQIENLRTVLASLKVLESAGYVFSPAKIKRAVLKARIRARFEKKNGVYLSTAHNPEAFEKFMETLVKIPGGKKAVIVFSILEDKDADSIMKIISQYPGIRLVLTGIDSPRALAIEKMEKFVVKYNIKHMTEPDNFKALKAAKDMASGAVVAAAGSFYLAGRFA